MEYILLIFALICVVVGFKTNTKLTKRDVELRHIEREYRDKIGICDVDECIDTAEYKELLNDIEEFDKAVDLYMIYKNNKIININETGY